MNRTAMADKSVRRAAAALSAREGLFVTAGRTQNLEHVEAHRLRQRPALAGEDLVAGLHTEGGRHVHGRVLVPLLEPLVLRDVVQVILADDHRVLHLRRLDHAGKHLAADVDVAGPRALLVDVRALNRSPRRLDAKANGLVVARLANARLLCSKNALLALEDVVL